MAAARPEISIIGPGRVGTALGVLARRAGRRVVAVGARRIERAREAALRIGAPARACSPAEAANAGDLVLLTVSDSAIERVCTELAEADAFRPGAVVAHCCGAFGSEILRSARDAGCRVASVHPLQTFPTVDAAIETLSRGETFCFCEGDGPALDLLEALIGEIGARPVRIPSEGKSLYHAAAVMACNYLTTLVDVAFALCERAEVSPELSREALMPLIRATLENIAESGTETALTGPIARGDLSTVRGHLDALAAEPQIRALYCAAGRCTVGLARRKGTLDATIAQQLLDVLKESREPDGREDH